MVQADRGWSQQVALNEAVTGSGRVGVFVEWWAAEVKPTVTAVGFGAAASATFHEGPVPTLPW